MSPVQPLEERVELARQLMIGLLERMGIQGGVEGHLQDGNIHLEIRGDKEGLLIGKRGLTLDSLQVLLNRMVNRGLTEPVRVVLDIDQYKKKREDSLSRMAIRLGKRAKDTGKIITIGPLNAHDRRIIHITLQREPFLRTEGLGEGDMKKLRIIPARKEGEGSKSLD